MNVLPFVVLDDEVQHRIDAMGNFENCRKVDCVLHGSSCYSVFQRGVNAVAQTHNFFLVVVNHIAPAGISHLRDAFVAVRKDLRNVFVDELDLGFACIVEPHRKRDVHINLLFNVRKDADTRVVREFLHLFAVRVFQVLACDGLTSCGLSADTVCIQGFRNGALAQGLNYAHKGARGGKQGDLVSRGLLLGVNNGRVALFVSRNFWREFGSKRAAAIWFNSMKRRARDAFRSLRFSPDWFTPDTDDSIIRDLESNRFLPFALYSGAYRVFGIERTIALLNEAQELIRAERSQDKYFAVSANETFYRWLAYRLLRGELSLPDYVLQLRSMLYVRHSVFLLLRDEGLSAYQARLLTSGFYNVKQWRFFLCSYMRDMDSVAAFRVENGRHIILKSRTITKILAEAISATRKEFDTTLYFTLSSTDLIFSKTSYCRLIVSRFFKDVKTLRLKT